MARPNSHSITKATDFVKQLFKKEEQDKGFTTKQETEPPTTLTLSARDSSKDRRSSDKYHRADTVVGVMNKFILQFSKVEQAYREIEKAFLTIVKSETQRNLHDKMKRKCEVKLIRPILDFLGYPEFSDSELKQIFNKDVESEDQITFKRLLVGAGLCYYEKQPKKKVENWKPKSSKNKNKTHASGDSSEIENLHSDYDTDDEKVTQTPSIDDDDLIVDPSAARRRRYRHISQGFDVVKKMFDKIDDDGSGEITNNEFKQAFTAICRDPEIVEARMAELDYNKDQEITFREFIFGIASWVGFNDPTEENDLDETTYLDETREQNGKENGVSNGLSSDAGLDGTNRTSTKNTSSQESNIASSAALVNNYSQDVAPIDSEKQTLVPKTSDVAAADSGDNGDNGDNHEPTVTETEDASFLIKKDDLPEQVETNVEKTYVVVSPKGDGRIETSQEKNSVEKSASNDAGLPPGYVE